MQDQLAVKARRHRSKVGAAKPSLLTGMLSDAQGNRFTPSHAVRSGRCYRYYVSAAPIAETGEDRTQVWRLAAQEVEGAVIRILIEALTSPERLLERFGTGGMTADQIRKMLGRAPRLAAALRAAPCRWYPNPSDNPCQRPWSTSAFGASRPLLRVLVKVR